MEHTAHRQKERQLLGPGLSAAVDWAGLVVERASGTRVWDTAGRSYLDFMGAAGVNSVGHSHPRLITAIEQQARSWLVGSHASPARLAFLERLTLLLPAGDMRTQLYSSGSEAVEAALRLAKSATGGFAFLSFWNAFHGRTAGSLALTPGSPQQGYGPTLPGSVHTPYADCANCPFRLTHPTCGFACVDHAREVVRHSAARPLAGIVVEPLQGRAGNIPPPPGYLTALRALADEFDTLLVVDESMTGFGRTGAMFAVEHDGIVPDIMILGKAMGGGYPVTAVVARGHLMSAAPYGLPSASSSSFGGFPLACRAAATVLDIVTDEGLVHRSDVSGRLLRKLLASELHGLPIVDRVVGQGLAVGVTLHRSPDRPEPVPQDVLREVVVDLAAAGLLVMASGTSLRLYPPLTVEREEIQEAVAILGAVLRARSDAPCA